MEYIISSRRHANRFERVHLLGSEQFSSCEEFLECGSIILNTNDEEDVENVSLLFK